MNVAAASDGERDGAAADRPEWSRDLAAPAFRFICTYAILIAALYAWGDEYSAWWCEPFETVLATIPSEFVVTEVQTSTTGAQRIFRMHAHTRHAIETPQGTAPAGIRMQTTTLQAYAHHHLVLIMAVLVGWPVRRLTRRFALLLAGLPAVVLATLLDLPFTLIGVAQDSVLAASNPVALVSDPAVLYLQFLQRGGRQVLSLALAGVVIVVQMYYIRTRSVCADRQSLQ